MLPILAAEVRSQILATVGLLVGLALVYLVLLFLGRRLLRRFERDQEIDHRERRYLTMWGFLRRVALVIVVILAIPAIFNIWELNLGPLIAIGGAVGIALGFGAQNVIRDVIAGFLILAENQYRVGDVVAIQGVSGTVEDIQVRLTVLRDLDGNVHYVPNGLIEVASNLSQEFGQAVIDLGVDYEADVDRALQVVRDELDRFAADSDWASKILEPPKVMGVQELGDSAVIIRSVVKVHAEARQPTRRELLRRLKKRMDAEGIAIPYPTQTLYLAGDS
ncbi:MAG: mechanosensitive ion channel family protein [Acidimicrobiia bacterium]